MALTVLEVRRARPGRHADGKGLYLLVKPSGAKSWVLRIQSKGRRRDYGLGSADLVTLNEAREKAREGRRLVSAGLDPSSEWRRSDEPAPTFEASARRYHSEVKAGWKNGKHGDQWLRTLEVHAFPALGNRRVSDVDAPAIQGALLPIWLSIPETARRVRQRIMTVLDYAKGQGWRNEEAPARAVSALLKGIRQPRGGNFGAMAYEELPGYMARLRGMEPTVGRAALEFLILTAARSGEVRGALASEIDWGRGLWVIPAHRMKGGEEHVVPLPEAALSIAGRLWSAPRGGETLIFPGTKGRPLSDATLAKAMVSAGANGCTVHGFRSAFKDWAREQCPEIPDDVSEAALAHKLPSKVKRAYQRTSFLAQRRELMDRWAAFLVASGQTRRRARSAPEAPGVGPTLAQPRLQPTRHHL